MAFLLPAAYEYADYAAHWRAWVASTFERTHVYRVSQRVFDDVQEGSVVLIVSGYKKRAVSSERIQCDSAVELVIALQSLERVVSTPRNPRAVLSSQTALSRWDDVFDMRIGIVSGHNASFVLSEDQRRIAKLPFSAVRPILGRARHIAQADVSRSHWEALMRQGDDVWLFCPSPTAMRSKYVMKYLKSIESARTYFKVRDREHWERPQIPHVPHGFLTGMSIHGPWIALNRYPGLLATNTLYTVRFKDARSLADRAAIAMGLLTSTVREQLRNIQRVYPDGLPKLEPRDLRKLTLPVKNGGRGTLTTYRVALKALLAGDEARARAIADAWFDRRA